MTRIVPFTRKHELDIHNNMGTPRNNLHPMPEELEQMTEEQLVYTAERDSSETRANQAMALLRQRHHSSYGWCWDCDGLVIREKDCCLNRVVSDNNEPITF